MFLMLLSISYYSEDDREGVCLSREEFDGLHRLLLKEHEFESEGESSHIVGEGSYLILIPSDSPLAGTAASPIIVLGESVEDIEQFARHYGPRMCLGYELPVPEDKIRRVDLDVIVDYC